MLLVLSPGRRLCLAMAFFLARELRAADRLLGGKGGPREKRLVPIIPERLQGIISVRRGGGTGWDRGVGKIS